MLKPTIFMAAIATSLCAAASWEAQPAADFTRAAASDPVLIEKLQTRTNAPFKEESGDPEVITETPEGTPALFYRRGDAFRSWYGQLLPSSQQGRALNAVTSADGNEMYFENFLSGIITHSWLKASVEGNKITMPMGQYAIWYGSFGLVIGVGTPITIEDNGTEMQSFQLDESITEVQFEIDESGVIRIESEYCTSENEDPEKVIGLFYSDDKSWCGNADWNSSFTPFDDKPTVFPEGLATTPYTLKYMSDPASGIYTSQLYDAAVDGDNFYLRGFSAENPDNVVIGHIDGNKVTFASGQYLGITSGSLSFFMGATYNVGEEETTFSVAPELTMNWDPETCEITPDGNMAWALNSGDEYIYYLYLYCDPQMKPFVEVPAVPATPVIYSFANYFEYYNWNYAACSVPLADVDGNYINPDQLKYRFWYSIEGEDTPYVFYSDEYPSISELGVEELEEVPYNFNSYQANGSRNIYAGAQYVYFYTEAPDAIGLQSIYYGGGERYESEIFWYAITPGYVGVDNVTAEAAPAAIYGLDGTLRHNMTKGINIIKMTDGTVRKVFVKD